MAHKKTFLVIFCVYKPAGDTLWTIAADFAGLRMKHIHTFYSNLNLIVYVF